MSEPAAEPDPVESSELEQRGATPEKDDPDAATRPPWAMAVLASLRINPSLSKAAETAGVARSTIWRLAQRDETFALAANDARDEALDLLEEMIYRRGGYGLPTTKTVTKTYPDGTIETTVTEDMVFSDTAAIFYLKRWRPEFRESYRVEQTGADGGPIRVRIEPERVDRDIRSLLDELAGRS